MKIGNLLLLTYIIFLISLAEVYSADFSFTVLQEKVEFYKQRYGVNCANEKITDNFGNGYDALYGTRNMRTILYGIAYRGGANNFYHKTGKRENHNPLPEDGLQNLTNEGFSEAVYLYSTNFSSSIKSCVNPVNNDTLNYQQNSGNSRKDLKKIMLEVKERIENPQLGPIYLHCWNGWHQSGYISAAILMQFCKISNEEAFQYWLTNTDGVNKGYEGVKGQVRDFVPFEDINISDSTRKLICPCLRK
jgi:hypothetical protein